MKAMDDATLAAEVVPHLATGGAAVPSIDALTPVVALLKERARTLVELADQARVLLFDEVRYEPQAVAKFLGEAERASIESLRTELAALDRWDHDAIAGAFARIVERSGLKLGKLAQPVRVALTGGTVSPGIFEVCVVLGRERTLARLGAAVEGARAGTLPLVASA
jgi:glutamyl-tRNA synthetase